MVEGSGQRQGLTAVAPLRNPPLSAGRAAAQPVVDLMAQPSRPRRYPRQRRRRFGGHCRNLTGLRRCGQIVRAPAGAPHEQANGRRSGTLKVSPRRGRPPGCSQHGTRSPRRLTCSISATDRGQSSLHPDICNCRDAAKIEKSVGVLKEETRGGTSVGRRRRGWQWQSPTVQWQSPTVRPADRDWVPVVVPGSI